MLYSSHFVLLLVCNYICCFFIMFSKSNVKTRHFSGRSVFSSCLLHLKYPSPTSISAYITGLNNMKIFSAFLSHSMIFLLKFIIIFFKLLFSVFQGSCSRGCILYSFLLPLMNQIFCYLACPLITAFILLICSVIHRAFLTSISKVNANG